MAVEAHRVRPGAAVEATGTTDHRTGRPAVTVGRVEFACRLDEATTAVSGWFSGPALPDRRSRRLATRAITFAHPAGGEHQAGPEVRGFLAVVAGPPPAEAAVIDVAGRPVPFDPAGAEFVDVESLAWLGLAAIGPADRAAATGLMAAGADLAADDMAARRLAVELRRFRDALRERPPHCQISPERAQGLFVDVVYRIDGRRFYLRGWARDASGKDVTLSAVSPEGARVELAPARFPRPDVEEFYGAPPDRRHSARPGFVAYLELPAASHLDEGWVVEMRNAAGTAVETVAPAVTRDPSVVRSAVLADLAHEIPGNDALVRHHTYPALAGLRDAGGWAGAIDTVTQHGTPPADPAVTVIVPLYRRLDFVEHQLAHFVDDPDLAGADLIYVLDSPEDAAALADLARPLHRLYGLPFRTVVLRRNLGFADANNAGASLARGRLLLLLNSDVVPDRPGWLSAMTDFYDNTPGAGAVGPKLVYEDGSIQHGGLYFVRPEGSPWWENAHYHKGLHRSFPPATVTRRVPGVTGACLLVAREHFEAVGGLSGTYVQGDYEDSDLCLRLADLGLDCWYLADVELYHLEGQSYPTALRRLTSRFNTWLHTHLWDERITAVMDREGTR